MTKKYKYRAYKGKELLYGYNIQYTIRYSKAGIYQYAKIGVDDDDPQKVLYYDFRPSYVRKGEIVPSFEDKTFDEIMIMLNEFSYNNAEIYLINGVLPEYYHDKTYNEEITNASEAITKVIEEQSLNFFKSKILPIIVKNNWKISHSWMYVAILIYKTENGEWDNIEENEDSYFIQYLSHVFCKNCNIIDRSSSLEMCDEMKTNINNFDDLIRNIPIEQLEKLGIYEKIDS